jgi:hypothetical protein
MEDRFSEAKNDAQKMINALTCRMGSGVIAHAAAQS